MKISNCKLKIPGRLIWFILGLILILPVILPLFTSHVPGTADGLAHKFRLVAFDKAIGEGILRPRWLALPALGFGAPIFLFNYILPYYIVDAFYRFGVSLNKSVQVYEAITLVGSFIAMYLLAAGLWGRRAGLVAATVYAWAPYHLMTVYLYEGWGEMGGFVFPPLILYFIVKILSEENKLIKKAINPNDKLQNPNKPQSSKSKVFGHSNLGFFLSFDIWILDFVFLVVSWFLFILTHNVSVVMFSPVLLILAFFLSGFKLKKWFMVFLAFATACLISSFFTLPAILLNNQIKYANLIETEIAMRGQYFKSIHSMLEIAFSSIRSGVTHYLDFTIGLPIFAAAVAVILNLFQDLVMFKSEKRISKSETNPSAGWPRFDRGWRTKSRNILNFGYLGFDIISNFKFQISNFIIVISILLLLSLFLSNAASYRVWDLQILHYIVYPFRFLFLATFAGSLLAGFITRKSTMGAILFIILAVVQGLPYTRPWVEIFPFPNDYFLQPQTITYTPQNKKNTGIGEFLPGWANIDFLLDMEKKYLAGGKLPDKLIIDNIGGKIMERGIRTEEITAKFQAEKASILTVNTHYFPNWEAYIDDTRVPVKADANGRMALAVPGGIHKFRLIFGMSPVEKTADLMSLAGIGMLIGEIWWIRKLV